MVAITTAAAVVWIAALPVAADVVAARGAALSAAGRAREAFESYRSAARLDPEAEHFYLAGQIALRMVEQGRRSEAPTWVRLGVETLSEAERANPLRSDVPLALGQLQQLASGLPGGGVAEKEGALAAYRRALALAPVRVAALDAYASALLDLGKYEEALAQLQRSLDLDPGYAPTHGYLADAYFALGRQEEAIAAFRRALDLDPKSVALRIGLARAHARMGDAARAESEYQQALQVAPRNANLYLELSDLHRDQGDPTKAKQVLQRGLAALPGHPDLAAALGRLP